MIISFILNLPYSFMGLVLGLTCFPKSIQLHKKPFAIVFCVQYFWWAIGYFKGERATAIGNIILLNKKVEEKDLEHELVHVQQYEREPLLHPIFYSIEWLRHGYRDNKYEIEAYSKAGNNYYPH